MKAIYFHSFLLLLLTIATSCNHYLDKGINGRTTPADQGTLTFYRDSNVLIYKSNFGLHRDSEKSSPKPFYIKLPKGLIWYKMSNSETFSFFYKKDQMIAVYIDLFHTSTQDSVFTSAEIDIENLRRNFSANQHDKYNIWNITPKKDRTSIIVKKGSATILLYNISKQNADLFLNEINSFKFL